ncbi:MAG: hypothetical protein U1E78_13500 [Gammaproteobacteria bacterium]
MQFQALISTLLFFAVSLFSVMGFANERPSISFDGKLYHLSFFKSDRVQVESVYLPEGETFESMTSQIRRVELIEVFSPERAAEGMAYNYNDIGMPTKIIKGENTIFLGAIYSTVYPVVLDKSIIIFKNIKGYNRVVFYEYTKRDFNFPVEKSHEALKAMGEKILLDQKYIEMIKLLRVD